MTYPEYGTGDSHIPDLTLECLINRLRQLQEEIYSSNLSSIGFLDRANQLFAAIKFMEIRKIVPALLYVDPHLDANVDLVVNKLTSKLKADADTLIKQFRAASINTAINPENSLEAKERLSVLLCDLIVSVDIFQNEITRFSTLPLFLVSSISVDNYE